MHKYSVFEGFRIGPVLAALMVGFGVEDLIKALSWPMASLLTDAVNYLIRTGRFQVLGPGPMHTSPFLVAAEGLPAIVILVCGLRFGAWLRQDKSVIGTGS